MPLDPQHFTSSRRARLPSVQLCVQDGPLMTFIEVPTSYRRRNPDGGLPVPIVELRDLLAEQFRLLARSAKTGVMA